jgi:hypothetical protein
MIKQIVPKKVQLSITKSGRRTKRSRPQQVRGENSPRRLGKLIEPWLTLGNFWLELPGAVDQLVEFAANPPDVPEFPAFMFRAATEAPDHGRGLLTHLVEQIYRILSFCTDGPKYGMGDAELGGVVVLAATGGDYVMIMEHAPLLDFNRLLRGRIPRSRLGRCAMCRRFFYRWRTGKSGTKDCSEDCANRRRVNKYRGKRDQYEYHRYLSAEEKK